MRPFKPSTRPLKSFSLTLAVGVVGLIALGGCSKSAERVSVDLPTLPLTGAPSSPPPTSNFSIPSSDWSLPALDPTSGPSEGATSARVKEIMRANRDRLYKQLLARLLAAYHRKADLLRAERVASFAALRSEALDVAYGKVSAEYLKYASQKGPLVLRLAILAGFPDPDPKSIHVPAATEYVALRRFNESKIVRGQIEKLDSDFKAYAAKVLKDTNEMTDAKISDLLAELESELSKEEENTRARAAEELGRTQKELRPLLADQKPMALDAEPARALHFPQAKLPQVSVPAPTVSAEVAEEPQRRLEAELRVWLRVNRYVLAPKGKARDATKEFLEWRKQLNPIP